MPGRAADRAAPPALLPALALAVPLRIEELRLTSFEERAALARAAAQEIAEHGDNVLFSGPRRGDSEKAFAALVTGLAVGAHQPGGVRFAGLHWEAESKRSATSSLDTPRTVAGRSMFERDADNRLVVMGGGR
jgi:hypothetical protein